VHAEVTRGWRRWSRRIIAAVFYNVIDYLFCAILSACPTKHPLWIETDDILGCRDLLRGDGTLYKGSASDVN
jgi:hypothetical protein